MDNVNYTYWIPEQIKGYPVTRLQDAIQKNQKEVALNLYQMGMEIELIAKAVNLSVDEVNKILNN